MNETQGIPSNLHEPDRYEIRFQGHLDDRWADGFEGLSLIPKQDGTTILTGPVADQAALYGLLRTVRDLNLRLISVIRVEPAPAFSSETHTDHERPQ
ncbi:hypothetical protein [Paenibacillus sp. XY044]|uniref:hypothetical protein n=1 Tax=Paenibacillus sp. XY044 TaxID=2026089 RepID=UPI000B9923CC|nr:hypothetical protein [Paenibacillus sp. XY044]OZB95299.1 hypothetical protein CJP46_16625 [Paenibacillus sp. XY044]